MTRLKQAAIEQQKALDMTSIRGQITVASNRRENCHWESMPWLRASGFGTPSEAGTQRVQHENVEGP
jgi:hypothetical protein